MVIASLKRRAFKLPLPGYTNGARAMERCYNGLHMKWHPVTTFICGEEDPGSNDSPLLILYSRREQLIGSRVKEARSTVSNTELRKRFDWKSCSLSLCKMWDPYARAQDGIWLGIWRCVMNGGFPSAASPDKMVAQPCSSRLTSQANPWGRRVLPPFSNVRVHVGAIWRITWWQLQAWLRRKVSSPNSGPQMLTSLWNAEHYEVWINSCWHHHRLWTTLYCYCAARSEQRWPNSYILCFCCCLNLVVIAIVYMYIYTCKFKDIHSEISVSLINILTARTSIMLVWLKALVV